MTGHDASYAAKGLQSEGVIPLLQLLQHVACGLGNGDSDIDMAFVRYGTKKGKEEVSVEMLPAKGVAQATRQELFRNPT